MRTIHKVIYIFWLLGCLSPLMAQCEANIKEMLAQQNILLKGDMYMRYTQISSKEGENSPETENEIWRKDGNMRYENPYFVLLQDKNTQVAIFKDSKRIIIKPATPGDLSLLDKVKSPVDSLKKYALSVDCVQKEGYKEFTFVFPEKQSFAYLPYRKVILQYNPVLKRQSGAVYFYCNDIHTNGHEMFRYKEMSAIIPAERQKNLSALAEIYQNGKLKQEYISYQVTDLRQTKAQVTPSKAK